MIKNLHIHLVMINDKIKDVKKCLLQFNLLNNNISDNISDYIVPKTIIIKIIIIKIIYVIFSPYYTSHHKVSLLIKFFYIPHQY